MADEQLNQTPENSPIVIPTETVEVHATIPDVETISAVVPGEIADTPVPPLTSTIRNVRQTAQEREIIKTAPDVVVYLDGLPYLVNPYLNDTQNNTDFLIVNFNDHVQNFNSSYDTDNLVPTGSVNLSVPNHEKKFYQSPGGNNLITTMMEVQVFAKGYFLSPRGNSIYHRVFKGLTSHVTHTDNGKTLEISIQIRGILRFLEMMQIDVQPSLDSNSPTGATPYQSNQWNLDPYQQIADTFLRSMTFAGFQLNTIANKGQTIAGSEFARAVEANYIVKWQSILNGVLKDTHVMGFLAGSLQTDIDGVTKDSSAIGFKDPELAAASKTKKSGLGESDPARDAFVNMIRGYTPDFKVSTIQMINGRIVPRLERIRSILHNIGFEGYQDINGEIIFKAPLYNLDVTNLAGAPTNNSQLGGSPIDNITEQNNPFVVFLPEIEGESESEDESAIRATRMSIQGVYSRGLQVEVSGVLRSVASHIDIPKLSQFGLREEPARTVPWIEDNDKILLYSYAVNELVRSNRGWRTYQFSIPMRPELRLGFPMYIPHKDMYGYIKGVTINYAIGGAATMSIMLDTIRKRPMFPTTRKTKAVDSKGHEQEETILTTQPNLVMKWTKSDAETRQASAGSDTFTGSSNPQTARTTGTGDTPSDDPQVNQVGNPATQPRPQQEPVYDEELNMTNYRKTQVGTDWSTRSDTKTHNFRVQNDKGLDGTNRPFFRRDKWLNPRTVNGASVTGIDQEYYNAILTMQPYTDEKGYEVVGVFPLGRWKSLPEAYKETREGKITDYVNPQAQIVLKQQDALIFAGLGTPSHEPSSVLLDAFHKLTTTVTTDSSFELDYSTTNTPPAFGPQPSESNILSLQQPDNQPGPISDLAVEIQTETEIQTKVDLFISGTPQPLPQTKQELQIVSDNKTNTAFSTVIQDFKEIVP